MLRLRDIMTTDVVTMSADLSIREAMNILVDRHIGGAPVVSGDQVVGIVSATDLLDLAGSLPGVPREQPSFVEQDGPDDESDWRDGDEPPATFFTEAWPEAGVEVQETFSPADGPEWNALEEHTVSEAMTRGPLCALAPDVAVTAAADYMRRAGVHRLLVVQDDRLLGVVSTMDIARAVADNRLTSQVYVFGDRARPDERGWTGGDDAVVSGEADEAPAPPGWAEVPDGEMDEERASPTTPEEPY